VAFNAFVADLVKHNPRVNYASPNIMVSRLIDPEVAIPACSRIRSALAEQTVELDKGQLRDTQSS